MEAQRLVLRGHMSRLIRLTCVVLASLLWAHATCSAAERFALLIGNEAYNEKSAR